MKRPDSLEYMLVMVGGQESDQLLKYIEHLENIRDHGRKSLDYWKNHMTDGAFQAMSNALNP